MSVNTRMTDTAGNPVGGSTFTAYGDIIYKRVWETGFDVVGVDAVFDSGGITFFHVHLDKGIWTAVTGAKAILGSELFDLWTEGGYTEWYKEATGGVWEELP